MRTVDVTEQRNLEQYNSPGNVETYVRSTGLMPVEDHLFGRHVPPGSDVLDIGVGGGRTTPALSARAGRYVGIDFAPAMVEACQARFPDLEFAVGDAADLSRFRRPPSTSWSSRSTGSTACRPTQPGTGSSTRRTACSGPVGG
jgi:SAM-dependent methyltransferase